MYYQDQAAAAAQSEAGSVPAAWPMQQGWTPHPMGPKSRVTYVRIAKHGRRHSNTLSGHHLCERVPKNSPPRRGLSTTSRNARSDARLSGHCAWGISMEVLRTPPPL